MGIHTVFILFIILGFRAELGCEWSTGRKFSRRSSSVWEGEDHPSNTVHRSRAPPHDVGRGDGHRHRIFSYAKYYYWKVWLRREEERSHLVFDTLVFVIQYIVGIQYHTISQGYTRVLSWIGVVWATTTLLVEAWVLGRCFWTSFLFCTNKALRSSLELFCQQGFQDGILANVFSLVKSENDEKR